MIAYIEGRNRVRLGTNVSESGLRQPEVQIWVPIRLKTCSLFDVQHCMVFKSRVTNCKMLKYKLSNSLVGVVGHQNKNMKF